MLTVTHAALTDLQTAVTRTTSTSWPSQDANGHPPEPHAEISGDNVNPSLRLWYGPSGAPVVEHNPPILLSGVLSEQ